MTVGVSDPTITNKRMNPEAKEMLLEALRSGKYAKTNDYLRRMTDRADLTYGPKAGFCCLGVACEISGLGRWTGTDSESVATYVINGRDDDIQRASEYDYGITTLPGMVADWLGTDNEGNFIDRWGMEMSLTRINDESDDFEPVIEAIEIYF